MALPAFACSRRLTTITTGSRLSSSRVRVAGLSCLSSLSSLSLCSLLSLSLTATRVVSASRCLPPPSILGLFVCLGAPMARPPPQRANDLQRYRRRPSRPVAGPTLLTRTLSAPLPMAGPTRRVPAQRGNPSPPSPPALGEGPQAAAPFAISLGSGFFGGGGGGRRASAACPPSVGGSGLGVCASTAARTGHAARPARPRRPRRRRRRAACSP
jgi:hypothetical protein